MKYLIILLLFSVFIGINSCREKQPVNVWDVQWEAEIYPVEHKISTDSVSGAKLIYITSNQAKDLNLYFDWNCWFKDLSMMTFISDRTGKNELFGYVPKTGELIRLNPRNGDPVSTSAFVDFKTHDIYVRTDMAIFQWHVDMIFSVDSSKVESVKINERKIVDVPKGSKFFSALSLSANRQFLSATIKSEIPDEQSIVSIDIKTGAIEKLLTWDNSYFFSHVQFSKYNQNLLRFSYEPHRLWIIDTRNPDNPKKIHLQEEGELVTHEDWWVNDQLTFCGAYRKEESHVKVINIHDQKTRIIGAGAWWEQGTPFELSQYNWWHASGAPNGKWVVADNWHGHIGITDERTSHMRLLTTNHRIYGKGEHPHVGWAPDSKSVEFTTHKYGNPDVCIAYLPDNWNNPFMESDTSE